MAKLDAAERRDLPKSDFGEPGSRAYPMPDREHAGNAKARAKQMLKRGHISQAAYDKIVAKADGILGEKKGKSKSDPPRKNDPPRRARDSDPSERGEASSSSGAYGEGKSGVSDARANKINSRLQGNSESSGNPNGNRDEVGMRGSTANFRYAEYKKNPENEDGDMSDGADGASRDRFYRGRR